MSREERAQRAAERAARKARRPWPARHWALTGISVLILIAVIAAATSSGAKPGQETAGKLFQHPTDVQVTRCASNSYGFADATVTITNHSAKASDYLITVAFESLDGRTQIGTGDAAVNSLQPGQVSVQDVDSGVSVSGRFVCKVADAERTQAF